MKKVLPVLTLLLFLFATAFTQKVSYPDSWDNSGFNLKSQSTTGVSITYSVKEFTLNDVNVRGKLMKSVTLPEIFLFNDEGEPDLPGNGRYIAVPQGAQAVLHIVDMRTETIRGVEIAPAPKIPWATDRSPLRYDQNSRTYSANAFYPAEPVKLSEPTQLRGVDAVILGVTPFQYNPVTKELVVLRDIKIEVEFVGGNGQFGDDRLRSRWWDPILSDALLNYSSLPKIDYAARSHNTRATGYEYLIICPEDQDFISWADSIKLFRNQQGIKTGIATITEVGGNTTAAIETYINDAYHNWDIPPAAVLLLGDYGSIGSTIISPIWDNYCVSDHLYADVDNNDDEEEVVLARMTARNAEELEVMIRKDLDYERNPPTSPDFYNHPITALGWQTERWFQICSEVVGGYFKNVQGKDPVRINAVYIGNPNSDPWSTATNTSTVLEVFGPNGLGYIPASPSELGGWEGGSATDVNNALNAGSFLLQHRDHGYELGWGEPDYSNSNIPGLTNTDLSFIFSINCLTGKYNYGQECFAEKFHRYTYNGQPAGALGLLAASEVSYSFVNDTYVWGVFDNLFPDFMPQYGSTPEPRGELPAFGNSAGKLFLKYSSWPYNTSNKEVTYNLFHHHGDAFTCLYSEVPQNLTVTHEPVLLSGLDYFSVTADEGSFICLSVDGTIIGTAEGTGAAVNIPIEPQLPPDMVDVVVTKQNYYRYQATLQIIPPNGPYVVNEAYEINDATGNNNGQVDYGETVTMSLTLKNVGSVDATNVTAIISTQDPYTNILDNSAEFGSIPANQSATVTDGFSIEVTGDVPNGHTIELIVDATDGDTTWSSICSVMAHAPILQYYEFTVSDPLGNNNGKLDPGETANLVITVKNVGSSDAYDVYGLISSEDEYISILSDSAMFGNLQQNNTLEQSFEVSASLITPPGHAASFDLEFMAEHGVTTTGSFETSIGQFPILVLDLDGNHNSGIQMKNCVDQMRLYSEYRTSIPENLQDYQAIFLCLGTYNQNHVLTAFEAEPFVTYLENGGMMYLEGADTWYYDMQYNPTPLQPMFKITGIDDGGNDLSTVKAVNGTFLDGYSFAFLGDNSYVDHISAVSPGYTIFQNLSPTYNIAVAYEGDTYRTIGSAFEFGGLNNNTAYTKDMLMEKYLGFFGFSAISNAPETPDGPTAVCANGSTVEYMTHPVEGASYYAWAIDPPEAGKVIGYDTVVNIEWDMDYLGNATVCVCGMNGAGHGPDSESLAITVSEAPTAMISVGNNVICEGDSTLVEIAITGVSPWHMEVMFGTYLMTFDLTKPFIDPFYVDPTTNMEVQITSLTDGTGCESNIFDPVYISVDPLPATAAVPSGPAEIDCYSITQSNYSTSGANYADSYVWYLDPAVAGSVTANGMSCTVDWNASYSGAAVLSVVGMNDCGAASIAAEKTVNVYNSANIGENQAGVALSVFPNPNEGSFMVTLSSDEYHKADLWISNAYGKKVWAQSGLSISKPQTLTIHLKNVSEGIYFLNVRTKNGVSSQKVMINK